MKKTIFSNYYMTLFSDGTLGISDGVGYIDTLSEDETLKLYEALTRFKLSKDKRRAQ